MRKTNVMLATLIGLLLLIVSGSVVLAGDAPIPDEPLPPEVKKLVGLKIPPKVVGKRAGAIPDFIGARGSLLNRQMDKDSARAVLGIDAGIVGEKWPIFIVSAIYGDRTVKILDIHLLPQKLLSWRYENGGISWTGEGEYIFEVGCLHVNSEGQPENEGRLIVGLEDTSFERDGYSTRIARAWEIDPQNGHIKSIPTVNIICPIVGGED